MIYYFRTLTSVFPVRDGLRHCILSSGLYFRTCCDRAWALAAGICDRGDDAEVAAALADGAGWLQLLRGGPARDGGFCS